MLAIGISNVSTGSIKLVSSRKYPCSADGAGYFGITSVLRTFSRGEMFW